MNKILIALEVTVKIIGFLMAEIIPFGRAIQKMFSKKETDDKKI